ncbi:uncharacterized protein CC84DRAFT_453402 [Paraphaeosphaeria sporulosa]|uniref:Uncharacterized protein n=1 Tax=Paraphaeosphaeria sporulosa TaxID=1460663 RepID=A0A177CRC9_9PLEO|nr:uncharacterized protein CC84DRAFT_453402 [Paraphaeosphaeria sporulosa]OAG09771.1 hypothetical protein CC84DRAFT_453402 [Paraphaeosphaeria sporulosa]
MSVPLPTWPAVSTWRGPQGGQIRARSPHESAQVIYNAKPDWEGCIWYPGVRCTARLGSTLFVGPRTFLLVAITRALPLSCSLSRTRRASILFTVLGPGPTRQRRGAWFYVRKTILLAYQVNGNDTIQYLSRVRTATFVAPHSHRVLRQYRHQQTSQSFPAGRWVSSIRERLSKFERTRNPGFCFALTGGYSVRFRHFQKHRNTHG